MSFNSMCLEADKDKVYRVRCEWCEKFMKEWFHDLNIENKKVKQVMWKRKELWRRKRVYHLAFYWLTHHQAFDFCFVNNSLSCKISLSFSFLWRCVFKEKAFLRVQVIAERLTFFSHSGSCLPVDCTAKVHQKWR